MKVAYKIAIASSDGEHINVSFGAADKFYIYEVEEQEYKSGEIRSFKEMPSDTVEKCVSGTKSKKECGSGCNSGCGGGNGHDAKVDLISDCRCIICSKIGFQVRKLLEKKAITAFDIEIPIEEALKKIVPYLYKVDKHISLRENIVSKEESEAEYE